MDVEWHKRIEQLRAHFIRFVCRDSVPNGPRPFQVQSIVPINRWLRAQAATLGCWFAAACALFALSLFLSLSLDLFTQSWCKECHIFIHSSRSPRVFFRVLNKWKRAHTHTQICAASEQWAVCQRFKRNYNQQTHQWKTTAMDHFWAFCASMPHFEGASHRKRENVEQATNKRKKNCLPDGNGGFYFPFLCEFFSSFFYCNSHTKQIIRCDCLLLYQMWCDVIERRLFSHHRKKISYKSFFFVVHSDYIHWPLSVSLVLMRNGSIEE